MKTSVREFAGLLKQAASSWVEDRAPSMGAALAYYTAFSLAPLMLIVIAVAGLVFGQDVARDALMQQLSGLVGEQGGEAMRTLLENARDPEGGVLSVAIGALTLGIGATTVFVELQDDLDRVWKAPPRTGSGLWNFLRSRLLSFGMILGIGFLLMVSLVVSTAISALGAYWSGLLPGAEAVLHVGNFLVTFGVVTALFALIYKFLPNVDIDWGDVWIGAAVTSLLFAIGKFLIGLYIGKSAVSSSFGAAGAFVVLLIWIYYSTQIFLLGAEFTYAYAHSRGSRAGEPRKSGAPAGQPARQASSPPAAFPAPGAAAATRTAALRLSERLRQARAASSPPAGDTRGGRLRRYVEEHPVAGIGALASGGFLLGALVRRLTMQKVLRHL